MCGFNFVAQVVNNICLFSSPLPWSSINEAYSIILVLINTDQKKNWSRSKWAPTNLLNQIKSADVLCHSNKCPLCALQSCQTLASRRTVLLAYTFCRWWLFCFYFLLFKVSSVILVPNFLSTEKIAESKPSLQLVIQYIQWKSCTV